MPGDLRLKSLAGMMAIPPASDLALAARMMRAVTKEVRSKPGIEPELRPAYDNIDAVLDWMEDLARLVQTAAAAQQQGGGTDG
ncbi:hypothetical protein [Roseomonas sp. USHLN139]|uniref:hypothetical protein n=1 Tax=Roseomonas sp. USHLN139 TaxID=3081298 RepID=UPI003B018A88